MSLLLQKSVQGFQSESEVSVRVPLFCCCVAGGYGNTAFSPFYPRMGDEKTGVIADFMPDFHFVLRLVLLKKILNLMTERLLGVLRIYIIYVQ